MKPKKIFLIRHGESKGNVDRMLYETVPDWKVTLTDSGHAQAVEAGKKLRSHIRGGEKLGVYVSPYYRTKETWEGIRTQISDDDLAFIKKDPRIREQEWGNLVSQETKDRIEIERDHYGPFFYRILNGESGADVYDRCTDFLSTIYRDFVKDDFPENILIVTHGFTLRVLLMRWLHWDVEVFDMMRNPKNCEMFEMQKNVHGKFYLTEAFPQKKYET